MLRRTWWLLAAATILAAQEKPRPLTPEERIELIRGLTAEYATAKVALPRSKKALVVDSNGSYDKNEWQALAREHGPAARAGDLVQITKVSLHDDRIVFEINGGFRGGRKWYERIQITGGMGTRTVPLGGSQHTAAPGGTSIALVFNRRLPPVKVAEVKKLLAPLLDFEQRSATEQYLETLPPPIRQAIQEKRAVEGMDRDQVLLALGRPVRKVRETVEGRELEDWIYGQAPGRIVFVTFEGNKVIRVKETYAGLASQGPSLAVPR
ncbi:MAG: hypothetical protein RMI94_00795 [Bryobacterales bacterium]|nr:hypothetical protein [Bryobacteraceae bacterium]MDW8129058.1 hypothetical protein [Bryobacterales bacterium]